MHATVEMAGFFAAHGVWCVSTGETLTPMFAYERPGGRQMDRLVSERAEEAVALGRERLSGRYGDAVRAVLVYDGYVTLAGGKTDALLIEARRYEPDVGGLMMAVPYRNAVDPAGFAVYRPKFLEVVGPAPDYSLLAEAFFRGVDRHERGAAVWNAHIDQSR